MAWQPNQRPTLSLHEKADFYQREIRFRYQTPEGLIKYRRRRSVTLTSSYGAFADGCFFTGLYLASQAYRAASDPDSDALGEVRSGLQGLHALMKVTDRPGLLARHFSPIGTVRGNNWHGSSTLSNLTWRADVSKDQYAGFIHGLGVTLAVLDDPELREDIAALSTAAVDFLVEHDFRIVDIDEKVTTHGNLSKRVWGLPIGLNAALVLAIAKVAAVSSEQGKYVAIYDRLVREGYACATQAAYLTSLDGGRRVNAHTHYLSLAVLLLLEQDEDILAHYRTTESCMWEALGHEYNALFAGIHGIEAPGVADTSSELMQDILRDFPDNKIVLPVNLLREPHKFPVGFLAAANGYPRSKIPVPIYLRVRSSNMWGGNPYRLVGRVDATGDVESAGVDYLLAYWMWRYLTKRDLGMRETTPSGQGDS